MTFSGQRRWERIEISRTPLTLDHRVVVYFCGSLFGLPGPQPCCSSFVVRHIARLTLSERGTKNRMARSLLLTRHTTVRTNALALFY